MHDFAHDSVWMRRLARSLVDEHVADDVVQEAWLKIGDRHGLGDGYLAQVVRSLALHWRRSEGRRSYREASSSRPEALPSTDEVAARIEVAQRLSRALNELDEPYRTTLVLHFYDGLSCAEIARRAGLPAGTIRARLKRGLDTLRARLDAGAGGRASWLPALLPLARTPIATSRTLATLASVTIAAKVAVGILLVVVTSLWIQALRTSDVAGSQSLVVRPTEDEDTVGRGVRAEPEADRATDIVRAELSAAPPPATAGPRGAAAAVSTTPLFARVVDEDGRALAQAWLQFVRHPGILAFADEEGRIERSVESRLVGDAPNARIEILVGAADHRTRLLQWPESSGLQLGDVALEPGGALQGRVVDETGLGLEGAVVAFGRPIDVEAYPLRARRGPPDLFPRDFSSMPPAIVGRTGPGGSFRLEGLPVGYGTAWARTAWSSWANSAPVAIRNDGDTDSITLVVTAARDEIISGRVVDPDGTPLPALEMTFAHSDESSGWWTIRTDAAGDFHFIPAEHTPQDITVRSPSWEWEHAESRSVAPGTRDLKIVFERSSWIAVVVTDEQGVPVRNGRVVAVPAEGPTDRPHERCESTLDEHGSGRLRRTNAAFRVLAAVPGYRNALVGPFAPSVQEPLTILVAPLPALVGTVVRADGTPAAGARVSLHRGTTARSGNLAPGQARSPGTGYLTHQGWSGDRDAFVYELFVEPTVSVETDGDGNYRLPLPGVDARAVDEAETPATGFAGLGYLGEGTQRLRGSESGQPWYLHAAVDGAATLTEGPHTFESELETRIDLRLPQGGQVSGELALDDGTSPLGWVVRASDGRAGLVEADVAPDGTFRLENLHAGGWQVRAFEPGRSYWPNGGRLHSERRPEPDVRVLAGQTSEYRHEAWSRESAQLFGQLLVDGRPPGAWVVRVGTSTPQSSFTSHDTTLDVDGRFRVTLEPDLKTTISVQPPGLGSLSVSASPTIVSGRNEWSTNVETATIAGTLDSALLPPPNGFQTIAYVVETGSETIRTILEPDAEGRVHATTVAAGHGVLYAPRHDWREPPAIWAELDLEPGQATTFQVR